MLWFGKKKDRNSEVEDIDTVAEVDTVEPEYDEMVERVSEDEIIKALSEPDEPENVGETADDGGTLGIEVDTDSVQENDDDFDEDDVEEAVTDEISEESGDEPEPEPEIQVTKLITCFDELCTYINGKPVGYVQYMRKENNEVFQLRDYHLRLARVWGSNSMYRQFSDRDYARIMLAIELIESPNDFYVLPIFTDSETEAAIMTFCEENFKINGKKYVKNTAKFAKLVQEKGCLEDWNSYTGELMRLKAERFCDKNGIVFDRRQTEAEDDAE